MAHQHIYNAEGKQLCCTQEQKIYQNAKHVHVEEGCCSVGHSHEHQHNAEGNWRLFIPSAISLTLLVLGLLLDHVIRPSGFQGVSRLIWYIAAYLPVAIPVLKDAGSSFRQGDYFSEFFLMGIATLGAFAIGEYPEAVAVMLFYSIGEAFQTMAVSKAKGNIKALLDQRPDEVSILLDGQAKVIKAHDAKIGDIIQLRHGEKLGLDGELLSEKATFNTAALTGESVPDSKKKGEAVLAGMINLDGVSQIRVTTPYNDSKLSRILDLVQNATAQKAPTELFIRKFAKVYTPIVVLLAVAICLLPYFFVSEYHFKEWLYRSLIFLVISCPCALVISIPLGYFGGIGAASRNGILFKGSNFLDSLAKIQNVVMDKTGTLTEGVFKVSEVVIDPAFNQKEILNWVNVLESHSTHPVATAIHHYVGEIDRNIVLHEVTEIAGHGLKASINGQQLLVGNFKLLDKFNIAYDVDLSDLVYTVIAIAYSNKFVGYLTISDQIKEEAGNAIKKIHALGVQTTMLSGDKNAVVQHVAKALGIDAAYGDLLPEDKVNKVKALKSQNLSVAFVGDGVNDAPVVALSDVGMAMGGLGSDATIETADVVIQDDNPAKIPVAINIGKATKKIVWQNVALAFIVKGAVLILGAGGIATMWEAVFADVGVALLAIFNAVRIQRMNF